MKPALRIGVIAAAFFVVAMLLWQGVTANGAPDPMRPNTSPTVAFLDIGILVFREGLECILVLAAITASMIGAKRVHRQPVALGAGLAIASLITWVIAVRIVSSLSDNVRTRFAGCHRASGDHCSAGDHELVLHKIYWGGWIRVIADAKRYSKMRAALDLAAAPLVWIGPARIHFPLSGRI
jgi:high-affinity iron transporter